MSWAKICDTLHSHPKALDADLEAMGLWVRALSHCAAYATDGHVKRSACATIAGAPARAERLAGRLVLAGLWEEHPSGDGWQVHDYLEFNPSRERVLAEKARKSEGGRLTAAKRWGGSSSYSSSNSSTHAAASGIGDAPVPVPVPVPREREILVSPSLDGAPQPQNKKAPKHTAEEIAAKKAVLEHFCERFESVKGIKPKNIDAADNAAAFKLVRLYGADEANGIIDRAFGDTFVVEHNCTLKFIASKADTYRGNGVTPGPARPAKGLQPVGHSWTRTGGVT